MRDTLDYSLNICYDITIISTVKSSLKMAIKGYFNF